MHDDERQRGVLSTGDKTVAMVLFYVLRALPIQCNGIRRGAKKKISRKRVDEGLARA
jgi:hypothetical protein